MQRKDIDPKVRETLDSLEGLNRAAAPDFLYVKVQAGIAKAEERNTGFFQGIFAKPAVSFTVLLVTAIINLVFIFQLTVGSNRNFTGNANEQQFAKTYGIVAYTAYNK